MRQEVCLALHLACSGNAVGQPGGGVTPVRERRRVVGEVDAGIAVECAPLLGRAGEPLLVGLPMHRDQPLGELAEDAHRRRRAADIGPRAPRRADRSAQHQRAVVVDLAAGVGDPGGHWRVGADQEPPVDTGRIGAAAHPGRIGTIAEQQQQAGHDHGLSGAGLAGDDREPRGEWKNRIVDHPETTDAELFEHVPQASRSHLVSVTQSGPVIRRGNRAPEAGTSSPVARRSSSRGCARCAPARHRGAL